MLNLAAGDYIAAIAQTVSKVTCTISGMELSAGVEVYKVLDQRQLPIAAANIYQAPALTQSFVKSISIINTDTVTQTFQLFRGGLAQLNAITPVITLPIGGAANYEDGEGWQILDHFGQLLGTIGSIADSTVTFTDITTGDVSITKHGYAPKAPNDATKFLRGDATWAVPASAPLTKTYTAEATSFTAAVNTAYWITGNGVAVTLPAAPADNDFVIIANGIAVTTCSVLRNGKNIMGLAADMTIDTVNFAFTLVYKLGTTDWRLAE